MGAQEAEGDLAKIRGGTGARRGGQEGGRNGGSQVGHRWGTQRPRPEGGGGLQGVSQTGGEARLLGVWERRVGQSGHSQMRAELKGFPGARLGPRVLPSKKELAF